MPLILVAVAQERQMKLADVVLGQAQIRERPEHQIHRLRVACNFLLVAREEGRPVQAGQKRFDLRIGEPCAFDARGRADAFDRRHLAQGRQAFRGERTQGLPPALELIDLCDKFDKVGRQRDFWLFHGRRYPLSYPIIPDFTR
jgi:hypothetical protein